MKETKIKKKKKEIRERWWERWWEREGKNTDVVLKRKENSNWKEEEEESGGICFRYLKANYKKLKKE